MAIANHHVGSTFQDWGKQVDGLLRRISHVGISQDIGIRVDITKRATNGIAFAFAGFVNNPPQARQHRKGVTRNLIGSIGGAIVDDHQLDLPPFDQAYEAVVDLVRELTEVRA